ncbi:Transposable element Tcb2 transposase [Labeo rohita]|uniref:Transposable element Tcb2 transposase n=1 Tax=Labeo rohita TaxID=84645 RepID=A0ABQ8MBE0_LABRO|nr:Transposable element Tcb2 transposase [Labeo rohita]
MVSQFGSLGYTIMGKTADLTVVQKTIIGTLHKECKTQTFIAKESGCSQSAVSKHVNRKLSGRKKCGRKRCTANRENRSLERLVKQNPFKNLNKRRLTWAEEKKKRAEEKKKWTVAQWSKILFSDESKFSTVFFENQSHRESLEHFMLPSTDRLFKDADFIFQQDLAPAHTTKSTKTNSPDLNPIENLWGIDKRKMRNKRPKNADELKATVKEAWASIPPQQCHRLITSMPRRIEAIIKAKGAPTKY